MKVRTGFVSNSSTSSFILIGIKALGHQIKEWKERHPEEDWDGDDNGLTFEQDAGLLGVVISSGEDVREFKLETIEKAKAAVKKEFGEDTEVRLWHWARYS